MSLSKYAKCVDSGVEWLGKIPSHWVVKRLRFVADINPSKTEVSHLPPDTEVSFIPMEAIGEDGSLELGRVRPLADVQAGFTFFRDGDVTIAKITPCFENGKGAAMRDLCNGIGFGTTELIVTRPKATQTTSRYLHWLFTSRTFRKAGEAFMYGAGGQKRVPNDFVRDFSIGFPTLSEQLCICTFLDREATKIDALVEEQRRLIALLKEKRQAVISHAVTKGLNPDATMKDSEEEWLGSVPAHWTVQRLRFVAELNPSKSEIAAIEREVLVSFLPMEAIGTDGGLNLERERPIAEMESGYTFFREGDVTVAKITPCFENGKGAVMRGLRSGIGFGTTELIVARPGAKTSGEYLHLCFVSTPFLQLGASHMYGAGGQKRVPEAFVKNFSLALPPLVEQRDITVFIDRELIKIDSLVEEQKRVIELLRERRSALISAAVTGKIDVRAQATAPLPELALA